MYDRNLGSYVWCGTGRQARPRCKVCDAQMLPVISGSKDRYGGRGVSWVWEVQNRSPIHHTGSALYAKLVIWSASEIHSFYLSNKSAFSSDW